MSHGGEHTAPRASQFGALLAALALAQACGGAPAAPSRPTAAPAPVAWESRARQCVNRGTCDAECTSLSSQPEASDDTLSDDVLSGDLAMLCSRRTEALAAYERAWVRGPRGCGLARAIASLRWSEGDPAGALEFAASAPPCRALDLWLARNARTRAPALAERVILRRLSLDPEDADFLTEQTSSWIAQSSPSLAEPTCARAEALAHASLHDACALVAIAIDAQHEAERHFRRAASLEPTVWRWLNLGRFLMDQRQFDDAAEAFRAALTIAPRDYDATVGLGRALTPACWYTAREVFTRAQALEPQRPEAFLLFGAMTSEMPCRDPAATGASLVALDRFVEIAQERPDQASALRSVTRRCTRRIRIPGQRSRWRAGQSEWQEPTCEPGLIQRQLFYCSGPMLLMLRRQAPVSISDCSVPPLL